MGENFAIHPYLQQQQPHQRVVSRVAVLGADFRAPEHDGRGIKTMTSAPGERMQHTLTNSPVLGASQSSGFISGPLSWPLLLPFLAALVSFLINENCGGVVFEIV